MKFEAGVAFKKENILKDIQRDILKGALHATCENEVKVPLPSQVSLSSDTETKC